MELVNLPLSLRALSDNFRNPLSAILALVELLKDDPIFTHEQHAYINEHYVNDIEISGRQLEALADKLLEARKVQ